jgi:hypothetical protein
MTDRVGNRTRLEKTSWCSQRVCPLRTDPIPSLVFLENLPPALCPGSSPIRSPKCCEGNLTSNEGLVALSTWKRSSEEERVGVVVQPNDGEFTPTKKKAEH